MALFLLFESASGYALFERVASDVIGNQLAQVQASVQSMEKFSKVVKLRAFLPFSSEKNALDEINSVSEGVLTDYLREFLEQNLPKSKDKKSKPALGVAEEKLAAAIAEALGVQCTRGEAVLELLRGVRLHFGKFVAELKEGEVERAQLGLGRAYSRSKVKFNVNRVDNMIIQSSSLLEQLEKDINTFAMRVREWYGWHFPELVKLVPDNIEYAAVVEAAGNKAALSEESVPALAEALGGDAERAAAVVEAARRSMGTDIAELDLRHIRLFATKVSALAQYRKQLHAYQQKKMHDIAPNLSTLLGEQLGAKLIAHAGSLTSLAKYPASTVQILGAEKALFRALKTRGNTPKYGLLFHSSFIGKAGAKNKGRISRYLANKCSIAARIDSFSDTPTTIFGEKMRDQVTERLRFYETGETPRKNIDVMKEALQESLQQGEAQPQQEEEAAEQQTPKSKKTKHPKPAAESDGAQKPRKKHKQETAASSTDEAESEEQNNKKKKKKHREGKQTAAVEDE